MVEKIKTIKLKQTDLSGKFKPTKKTKCQFCKGKFLGMDLHLKKCHKNPGNFPIFPLDWDYIEKYQLIKEFLIKNPQTTMEREFNKVLAPQGDPFESFINDMLNLCEETPNTHRDRKVYQTLNKNLMQGIKFDETEEEQTERLTNTLKEKIEKGITMHLFDYRKPTTIKDLEENKDKLQVKFKEVIFKKHRDHQYYSS